MSPKNSARVSDDFDVRHWTSLIDEIVAGEWIDPETGKAASVPYESIVFQETLDGAEADLVRALNLGSEFTVVADEATYGALGQRVARNLEKLGPVKTIVLDSPHADMETATELSEKLRAAEGVVAVGSGTVNDLTKYATFLNQNNYCVFGTAASMNGYTSTTASLNLPSGLKVSLPAQAPLGFFVDLQVSANAPSHLTASGFADCMARSVAQVDWWMSHRLKGTDYWTTPYLIQDDDEVKLNENANLLPRGDIEAIAALYRVLTLCGLGISFTGVSNHGSMAEHQISHYIDCFAGNRHPGTLHGQQVGVASLSMARLQQQMLGSSVAPQVSGTQIDLADMSRRMGSTIASQCKTEWEKKAFSKRSAEVFNEKIADNWAQLKQEVAPFIIPVDEMEQLLKAAGSPTSSDELGLDVEFYREAVRHNHEMRNRFTFVDIASGAGILDEFAEGEV